jgi:tetratricopeptide (TPR) repeat protein
MLDAFMTKRNFLEIYRFTGILAEDNRIDTTLYREKDVSTTLNNYGVVAAELANALSRQGDPAGAVHWAEISVRIAPQLRPANAMLGILYFNNNQRSEAVEHYRRLVKSVPSYPDYWLNLAWVYADDDPALALQTVDEALAYHPDDRRFYVDGFRYAARLGKANAARSYAQRWLEKHPDDREMLRAFEHVDSLIQADFSPSSGGGAKMEAGG